MYLLFSLSLETYVKYGKDAQLYFIDFKQAYDSIVENKLWVNR